MPQDPEPDHDRIRRNRNMVLALLLGAFAVLVYFISIAKMV
jgi:hypothetical protein